MEPKELQEAIYKLQQIGLTQYEIADGIPCNQSTISSIVTGRHGLLRPSHKLVSGLERMMKKYSRKINRLEEI